MPMTTPSLSQVQQELKEGKTTVRDQVQHYLNEIENHKELNAFVEVFTESALKKADEVDEKMKSGAAGKLAGLVIGIKDNICYKDHKVSASSKILEGFESLYSATVVERLLEEDAVIIGRLNCDEFAMGSSNEKSVYGSVKNPVNTNTVPGGSSGGSAAAVAAGLCTATLGSDTGGSIRQPASFTGTIGLKPTYGRVSRYGLIAYASSFDQIGPFTNNLEDAAALLEVISGKDEFDATLSSQPVDQYAEKLKNNKEKLKLCYIQDCLSNENIDPEIKNDFLQKVDQLKEKGHEVEPVSFDLLNKMVPTYYVITTAEASSNLSRFDGVHYGRQTENVEGLESVYVNSRTEGFGTEVKRRIMLGSFVLSSGYYDAYYSKAQKVRRLIQDKTNALLEEYDFIITPTTPTTAFKFGSKNDPVAMYLQDIFTVHANLSGNPAISLPLGKSENGMPFGTQLLGKNFSEARLLSVSKQLTEELSA